MANLFYTNVRLVVNGLGINYIDKLDFLRLFYQARLTTFTSNNIKSILQTARIIPFDPQNVLSRLKVNILNSLSQPQNPDNYTIIKPYIIQLIFKPIFKLFNNILSKAQSRS
jgi:hypothetical protein